MTKTQRVRLTQARVDALKPPTTGECVVHDLDVPGLTLRARAGGATTWNLRYRVGGRGGQERRLTLGNARSVSLKDARDAARQAMGDRAKGADPQAVRKEATRKMKARLGLAVERYVEDLELREVAKAADLASLLRRELVAPLGAGTDMATLDRGGFANRIAAIAASGRQGTARDFRTRCSVFMNWAVGQGLIPHNPLLGMRAPRATRAQEMAQHGRALDEAEIHAFWHAADITGEPFYAAYLRTLLLTGCRRTELAVARWAWVIQDDSRRSVLVLPGKITKNGRDHPVPLPMPVLAMLQALPRKADTDLIFPAWRGEDKPMSGWSKRWACVTAEMERLGVEGRVTMHDCRRTARSWWTEMNVLEPVAELMLNHRPKNRLVAIYDRAERLDDRHEAAEHWANFVFRNIARDQTQDKQVAA